MTVTVLRPSATSSDTGWSVVPSGTFHGVTSDDNDASYALWSGAGVGLVLTTPTDTPPAGERRHQTRVRLRGSHGDAWWSVILGNGVLVGGSSAQFDTVPETVIGSWGFGAPPDGPTSMSAYITGQSAGLRAIEVYLDVDSRTAPTLTGQVVNGAGTVTTTITDTATPVLRASAVDLDDLTPRQYRYWVTLNGAIVWDSGVTPGRAADRATSPLDNGSYVAHYQVWSTLGANLPYPSQEETLAFTVNVGAVPAPANPNVTPVDGTPFYDVSACVPDVSDFDDGVGWVEIQRVDCPIGGALFLPGSAGAYASTGNPGHAFTDLQIEMWAQRDDGWRPADDDTLTAWGGTGELDPSWRLHLDADGGGDPALAGRLVFSWSPDGVSTITTVADRRVPVDPYGRARIRVTLDTDDGAGEWLVTWEHEMDGEWLTFATPVSYGTGTTTIDSATGGVTVGGWVVSTTDPEYRWNGRIYSMTVRDGATVVLDPDFTGRVAGTDTFTDPAGNDWTVHAPAAITSDQRITTVAIQGPLETDGCTSYVDYSLPRTGVGITCEHQPEPCCSYYRARTLVRDDGALQVSDWSGAFNPGIPEGLIVMWPGAATDIPTGWSRTAALDGKYPKGVATSVTQPGATGGSDTHTHPVLPHTHDTDHSHTVGGSTSAAVGTVSSHDGAVGTTAVLASHTHTMPADTGTADVTSGPGAPAVEAIGNDPDRLDVIWIESDGNPLGVPPSALSITADTALTGWDDYGDATGRFLKGAPVGQDGGATATSTRDHVHALAEHTHAGTSHSHFSLSTGSTASTRSLFAGPTSVIWSGSHSHPVTVGNATSAPLGGAGSGGDSSEEDTGVPPYRNVRVRQNVSGVPDLPVGLICAWRGSLGTIPDHWQLCDGTGGTPDLIGRYPRGAVTDLGDGGGAITTHSHTGPSHSHPTSGHSHSLTIGTTGSASANVSSTVAVSVARSTHTHTAVDTGSATPEVDDVDNGPLEEAGNEPAHEEVAFVQLMETPTPPAAPPVFCLTWSDSEHLIRSRGPQGPLWAPVLGRFNWAVDRPFSATMGVNGGRYADSGDPGGRNLSMVAAVESEQDWRTLRELLARPLVLISPSDAAEVWAAPVGGTVRVVKVGRLRQVTAEFIATGPQPPPQLADVG